MSVKASSISGRTKDVLVGYVYLRWKIKDDDVVRSRRYKLYLSDLRYHGMKPICCYIRDRICIHEKQTSRGRAIYVNEINCKMIEDLMKAYAYRFFNAKEVKVWIVFEEETN